MAWPFMNLSCPIGLRRVQRAPGRSEQCTLRWQAHPAEQPGREEDHTLSRPVAPSSSPLLNVTA